MIRAGHIEQCGPPNAIFFRHANRRLHFCQFPRNHDLRRGINVGHIDVFIRGQLAHLIFVRADHRRHAAYRCRARFIHQLAAFLHELQSTLEIEGSGRGVRCHFTQRESSGTADCEISRRFA